MGEIQRLAVLTSGGDAPGMNAAIRAVVRAAAARQVQTLGVRDGFAGLLAGRFQPLDDRSVGGILHRGGTILGSTRCPDFHTFEARERALMALNAQGVGGLVVIGGDGSQRGALALHQMGLPVVGVASTIDNDLAETEATIGFDTALNTAMTAIDRLKDTATSHHRAVVVEVMGRNSGYLALLAALATGAEFAVLPEREMPPEAVADDIQASYARGKAHYIAVVAEGAKPSARVLAEYLRQHPCAFDIRLTVLGHVQRGGSPSASDRLLASQLGAAAVGALLAGRMGVVLCWRAGAVAEIAMDAAVAPCNKVTPELLALADVLAR